MNTRIAAIVASHKGTLRFLRTNGLAGKRCRRSLFNSYRMRVGLSGLLCSIMLVSGCTNIVDAQAVLYDNTDHKWSVPHNVPKNVLWIGGGREPLINAQPFNIGGHDNISSVSIPIGLEDSTPTDGSYRVTLWEGNEAGVPGREIHEFGVVDLSELTVASDFDGGGNLIEGPYLPEITLSSNPATGLTPGGNYFLVHVLDNLPSSSHGIIQGLTNSRIGSNGAGDSIDSPESYTLPIADEDWTRTYAVFAHGNNIQMRIESAANPYEVATTPVGEVYSQSFDLMQATGDRGFVPNGWAYYDEVVENEDGPADDEIIYNTFATHAFPTDSRFRLLFEGPTLFNAGVPGESDRALAIGTHLRSREATLQFVTELTGGNASSLQLAFDVEAWESDRSKDDPGEAAFDVMIDVDSGDGFEPLANLGKVTTGATLAPATGDYVNGNDDAYRVSFESEKLNVAIPEGSQIRVRWKADLDANTRGWIYGLDNVALSLLPDAPPVLGDFNGDGLLSPQDIDLLSGQVGITPIDVSFDVNADGIVDLADHQHWVESEDYANTFFGDANLDGTVDFPDFLTLSAGFGQSGGWGQGDFDGNGEVEFPDFLALSKNFGKSSAAAVSVPEPSSLCLLGLGLIGILRGRQIYC